MQLTHNNNTEKDREAAQPQRHHLPKRKDLLYSISTANTQEESQGVKLSTVQWTTEACVWLSAMEPHHAWDLQAT